MKQLNLYLLPLLLMFVSLASLCGQGTVKGKVTDEAGNPLEHL